MNIPGQRKKYEVPEVPLNRCPKGHELPNTVSGIECSSLACGGSHESLDASSPIAKSEEQQVEIAARRMLAKETLRNKLIPLPEGLEGAAAESYVESRLTNLSVIAVAELEWQLRFGSDSERAKAAKDILDATGHGKKDRTGGSTQLIIVNGVVAGAPLPWAKTQGAIVTAEAPKALTP